MTFDRDNEMDFENRVIAPEYVPEDAEVENPLRPRTFADYVGDVSFFYLFHTPFI